MTYRDSVLPMQPGDAMATWAGTADLDAATDWKPTTNIEEDAALYWEYYRTG